LGRRVAALAGFAGGKQKTLRSALNLVMQIG